MMQKLRYFPPIRRSLRFDLVGRRHDNEFFEQHFCRVVRETFALAWKTFCPRGERETRSSPWKQEYSSLFGKYVELVARSDPLRGEWDILLCHREERKCLLLAIIMKILEVEVFSSLLFGADLDHRKRLERTNVSRFNREGFRRVCIRAQINCDYLRTKWGQPPLFWDEVDKLCLQVFTLVVPLYEWTSKIGGSKPMPYTEVYQCFHDTISYACWLGVCIQTSPAIIHYDWEAPGELFRLNHVNFNHELYEESKKAASNIEQETTARVKISVIPKIVCYTPAVDVAGAQGIVTYTILEPHVIYYHGRKLDEEEKAAYVSLAKYLRKNRLRRNRKREGVSTGSPLLVVIAMMLSLWILARLVGHVWAMIK